MKLAEALAERSECQTKLEEIKKPLARSARVQEGEQPAEDSTELLSESERVFDAIAERDITGKRRDFLSGVADAASTRQDRYSKSEVKFVATVSISQLQKQVDQLSKQFRELDTRLQELNWQTELA
jgi:hypothetical protein